MPSQDSFGLNQIIDISLPVREGVPIWPDSTGVHLEWTKKVSKGDLSNLTRLDMDVHIGTHVESPLHSFADVAAIDQIPLEVFIGKALVAHIPAVKIVTAADLEKLNLPRKPERLLLRTDNSELWEKTEQNFKEDFVGLSVDAAQWIADRKIRVIGNDYLSVANFQQGKEVHEILLKNGVCIIEGLNLCKVDPGEYELICLPLRLMGREAAPARAILWRYSTN